MGVASRVLILAVFYITVVKATVLPVEKCKLDDSTCMVASFQKALPIFLAGIPESNVDVLDPMVLDDFDFDLSGLKFSLKEGTLKGFKNAVFDKVKWDLKKKRFEVTYHMNGSVKGHYTASGRLLVLPITGDGQFKLKLKNLVVRVFMDYKIEKGSDGKDHVVPHKYNFKFDVKDNAHFTLTNLFNGNKQLSDTLLNFINENWKQVSEEFGSPVLDEAAKKVFRNVVNYLKSVPLEDIALA